MFKEVKLVTMRITPDTAREWLKKNTRNRSVVQSWVDIIANAIVNDRWLPCTTASIAFFTDGSLADGQHRLLAILKANKAVDSLVAFGVSKDAGLYFDTSRKRSVSDAIAIQYGSKTYSSLVTQGMRWSFVNGDSLTRQEHVDIFNLYEADIAYIVGLMKGLNKKLSTSVMFAALFTALQAGEQRQVLEDFCELLKGSATYNDRDVTVLSLKEYLLTHALTGVRQTKKDIFSRIQNALWNFGRNQVKTNVRVVREYR